MAGIAANAALGDSFAGEVRTVMQKYGEEEAARRAAELLADAELWDSEEGEEDSEEEGELPSRRQALPKSAQFRAMALPLGGVLAQQDAPARQEAGTAGQEVSDFESLEEAEEEEEEGELMGQQPTGGEAAPRRAREVASRSDKVALWRAMTAASAARGRGEETQTGRAAGGVVVWDLSTLAAREFWHAVRKELKWAGVVLPGARSPSQMAADWFSLLPKGAGRERMRRMVHPDEVLRTRAAEARSALDAAAA